MTDSDQDDRPFVVRRDTPDLSDDRYPVLPSTRPPEGLGRKQARAWRKGERQRRSATLAAWRDREPGSTDGLGVVLLVVAVAVAALVFLRGGDDTPTEAAAAASTSSSGTSTTSTTASTTAAPTAAPPLAAADPALPPPFDVAGGTTARAFLAAYLTYDPTLEDPAAAWIDSWAPLATADVEARATTAVARLWDFTVQQQLTVSPGPVTGAATAGSPQVIFDVQAARLLTPLDGQPATTDTVSLRVTVLGDQVTNVQAGLTGISE